MLFHSMFLSVAFLLYLLIVKSDIYSIIILLATQAQALEHDRDVC